MSVLRRPVQFCQLAHPQGKSRSPRAREGRVRSARAPLSTRYVNYHSERFRILKVRI